MVGMTGAFAFMEGGRVYLCRVPPTACRAEAWWWFGVAGDPSWYVPFLAGAGDTTASVRSRVVAYYEGRLARHGTGAGPRPGSERPRRSRHPTSRSGIVSR